MEVQADTTGEKRPGRGLVVAGIVTMVIAVAGVLVATAMLAGSLDLGDLERDVVVVGPSEVDVPGSLRFTVIEDLEEPDSTMSVGVIAAPGTAEVHNATRCRITDSTGAEASTRPGTGSDTLASSPGEPTGPPLVVAEDLPAGDYTVRCDFSGDLGATSRSDGAEVSVSVGRVVTAHEAFDTVEPALWIVAAVAVGGFVGLVGLILLIVGLVIGNRARRTPSGATGT